MSLKSMQHHNLKQHDATNDSKQMQAGRGITIGWFPFTLLKPSFICTEVINKAAHTTSL